jgi:hypothetical protein
MEIFASVALLIAAILTLGEEKNIKKYGFIMCFNNRPGKYILMLLSYALTVIFGLLFFLEEPF